MRSRSRHKDAFRMKFLLAASMLVLVMGVAPAGATQQHGAPEGLYVHQLGHIFFALTMGFLIYWLHKWRLAVLPGWRHIRYAAYFFIAWNLDAMGVHWLDEQSNLISSERIGHMMITITTAEGYDWLAVVYYIGKLDNLLCVSALLYLFFGLRRLLKTPLLSDEPGGPPA